MRLGLAERGYALEEILGVESELAPAERSVLTKGVPSILERDEFGETLSAFCFPSLL